MWLDDDQDKVVAWLRARHEVCPQCGTTEADWIDPATRRHLAPPKWEATTYRCPGCVEIARVKSEVPDKAADGVRVVLIPATEEEEDASE